MVLLLLLAAVTTQAEEPILTASSRMEPAATTLAEMRAAEKRRIPLEVFLKGSPKYKTGDPVEVTIIVTNLFPTPLLMNSRMLVNHIRLEGEISFRITDAQNKPVEIQSLVTPLSVREDDFVVLAKGESLQRTVDLADLYGLSRRGTYKVFATYHNEVDFVASRQRAWKGRVWSEPIEVVLH